MLAREGVGDADGKPIEPTSEAIDALLDVWPIFGAFQLAYVSRGLLLEQEKTPPRSRRPVLRRGRPLLRGLRTLRSQRASLRVLPGAVIGRDMTATLALGDALDVPPFAMAELLPVIEAVMVAKLNEQMDHSHGREDGMDAALPQWHRNGPSL